MHLPSGRIPSLPTHSPPGPAPWLLAVVGVQLRWIASLMKPAAAVAIAIVVVASLFFAHVSFSQSVGGGGPVVVPGDGPPIETEGHFTATPDGRIVDPDGNDFVPVGANVSIEGVFDWGGTADGHSDVALAWGWNTVRLNVLVSDVLPWSRVSQFGPESFLEDVDEFVREYTDAGIVVIIDSHDLFMVPGGELGVNAPFYNQINQYWRDTAARYKNNPYVWFNLHNEPPVQNEEWYEVNRRSAKVVRDTGARNPIVVDAQVWGQDLGAITPQFKGARYSYEPDMAPKIAEEFGNVILSQHNYGSFDIYTDAGEYGRYVDRVRATGLPLIVGEFGMRTDGVEESPLQTDHNRRAVHAVAEVHRAKQVGVLWWHANHTDGWSLFRDDTAFFVHRPGTNLSEGGEVMWALR